MTLAINYEEGLGGTGRLQAWLEGSHCLFAQMFLKEVGFLPTGRFLTLVHRKGKLQINQRLGLINVSTVVGGMAEVLLLPQG